MEQNPANPKPDAAPVYTPAEPATDRLYVRETHDFHQKSHDFRKNSQVFTHFAWLIFNRK
jgi:hypothetical protein